MGVSQNYGYVFAGPQNQDCSILGSILGSPYFGKLPYVFGLGAGLQSFQPRPDVSTWCLGSRRHHPHQVHAHLPPKSRYTRPNLTWNLKGSPLKRTVVYKGPFFRFHACLAECSVYGLGDQALRLNHLYAPTGAYTSNDAGVPITVISLGILFLSLL